MIALGNRAPYVGAMARWAAGALSSLAALAAAPQAPAQTEEEFAQARERMVRETIARPLLGREAVTNERVLEAMRTVKRHAFVPEQHRHAAYSDSPLPIGHGQTISQPYIVAVMTAALNPEPGDKVLEIGTGSGYQAAVLGELVDEVYTIEIVEPLGERAAQVLGELGYDNVHTRIGDGYKGWPEAAPFDCIIVTAAPDHIPEPLKDQLKAGGRMIIPVGEERGVQQLQLAVKQEDGSLKIRVLDRVRFVPFTGELEDQN